MTSLLTTTVFTNSLVLDLVRVGGALPDLITGLFTSIGVLVLRLTVSTGFLVVVVFFWGVVTGGLRVVVLGVWLLGLACVTGGLGRGMEVFSLTTGSLFLRKKGST